MRKLASIQSIKSLTPIPGADSIETARVLGWEVVVRKGEFQQGDLTVYCEIDSLLPPENPAFAFLADRHFRIKTVKLRGQVSQGICFPLDILPAHTEIHEDMDVSELLGVKKYEPPMPVCLQGEIKGNFPPFIPKTDEPRVQILDPFFDSLKGAATYVAEKLDGSSMTVYLRQGEFGVCSRNWEYRETAQGQVFWQTARSERLEEKLREYGQDLALQGELIGPGIQKNRLKRPELEFRVFNIWDIHAGAYLSFQDFIQTAKDLGVKTVPVLCYNFLLEQTISDLVQVSEGKSRLNAASEQEGIVIRPLVEQFMPNNERFSFKVINPRYLLKYEE